MRFSRLAVLLAFCLTVLLRGLIPCAARADAAAPAEEASQRREGGETPGAPEAVDLPGAAGAGARGEDPFGRGSMNLQVHGAAYREAWGYNGHLETLAGGSAAFGYFFLDRLSVNLEVELLGVHQESWDTLVGGFCVIPRWHFLARGKFSLFFDAGLGCSLATRFLPEPNGTRFNFLILTSAGATFRLGRSVLLTGCLRYMHLSNASLEGGTRNPDIDSLGGQLGVLLPF